MKKPRASAEENKDGLLVDVLLTRPNRVAVVALGSSSRSFMVEMLSNSQMDDPFDEVWTVNRGLRGIRHDKLFVMDDLRWLNEHNSGYAKFLRNHDKPIITSTPYSEYPMSVPYPFPEVMETIQDDVFAVNTVAYMLAYAIHTRVKEVSIYGADFVYPNGSTAEHGGQACAYLCGMMRQFDMVHRIPGDSTLLYANTVKLRENGQLGREPYGYHRIKEMKDKRAKETKRKKSQQETKKGK